MLQVDQTCDLYDSPMIFWGRGKTSFLKGETCWDGVWKIGFVEDSSVFLFQSFGG